MTKTGDLMWRSSIKGFLLDVCGVLYISNRENGEAIPGSIEAVKRLYSESLLRFVSNESTSTRQKLLEKLNNLGFELKLHDIFTPAPAAAQLVKRRQLRPYLLLHKGIVSEFDGCEFSNPNCVIVGDAEDEFTYLRMNEAFRILLNNPLLISLGCGFYQRVDGPYLDSGPYSMALKYASECEHINIGKPEEEFFMTAVNQMGLRKDQVVMIGDDIVSDIGGAQKIGIKGIQVRTGKWRSDWENHPEIKPDLIADDLLSAVRKILD